VDKAAVVAMLDPLEAQSELKVAGSQRGEKLLLINWL